MFGNPIANRFCWPIGKMKAVAPAVQFSQEPMQEGNWLLNLDAIQSNSGYILFKNEVSKDELTGSIMSFGTGNVLYSKLRPYLNKVVVPNEPGYGTTELIPLLPNPELLNQTYFACLLRSDPFVNKFSSAVAGTKMPRVSMDTFWKFDVPLPPIDLQNEFASFVKQVDKSRAICKQIFQSLDNLVKSRFIEEFGSIDLSAQKPEWKEISSLGKILTGSTPKTNVPEYWDGEIKWIAPAELTSETFYVYDTERKITEEGRKSCSLNVLKPGVVLLSSRAPIGKVAIVGSEMYCNQGFKNIECGPELNNVYLYILLKYNTKYLDSLGRGATFKEISAKIVAGIRIPAPPRAQQDRFEEFIRQVDKSKFVETVEPDHPAVFQNIHGFPSFGLIST